MREYLDWFNVVAMQIQDLDLAVELHSIKRGLGASPFADSLVINPRNMIEFKERAIGLYQHRGGLRDEESRSSDGGWKG